MFYSKFLSSAALYFFTLPLSSEKSENVINKDEEIENLRKKLASKQFEIITLKERLDNINALQKEVPLEDIYSIIPANILIKRDTSNNRNSFIIDRGANDNIRLGSLVVYESHLLGIIYKISPHSSIVLQVTDPYMRIPVSMMIPEGDDYSFYDNGICVGYNNNECKIKLLQEKKDIQILDDGVALTSGFAKEYPRGLIIGKTKIQKYSDSFIVNVHPIELDNLYNILVYTVKKE